MIAALADEDVVGVDMLLRPCRRVLAMSRMRCDEVGPIEDADHVGKLMNLDDAPRPIGTL